MTYMNNTPFPIIPANKRSIDQRQLIYGVGINDADYVIRPAINGKTRLCPLYSAWRSMIMRVYSSGYQAKQPTYKDCSITPEWLSFMAFREWMELQDWPGKELDKDILLPGNKVYSPETCLFVTKAINSLLVDCGASRGRYPLGVSACKNPAKFRANIRIRGKNNYLGEFNTPKEAGSAYREAKLRYVLSVADSETDSRVKQGLYRHAELFR